MRCLQLVVVNLDADDDGEIDLVIDRMASGHSFVFAHANPYIDEVRRFLYDYHPQTSPERGSTYSAPFVFGKQQLEELKAQVAEAIVPPGEPGALTTLRDALGRVDVLGEAVAQLCEYMQSLKVKEVASAAEARISELEGKLASGGLAGAGGAAGAAASQQLEARLSQLEDALAQEQQSSLRALQAILEAQGAASGGGGGS